MARTTKAALAAVANARVGLAQLADNQFEDVRRAIGGARVVLIGEETHGTHEFYALRAEITKALIEREHFSLVLCESDFPSFYKLHQYVGGGAQAATQTLATSPSDVYSASNVPLPPASPSLTLPPPVSPESSVLPVSPSSPVSPTLSSSPPPPPLEALPDPLKATTVDPNMTTEQVMEVLKARFPVWMWRNEVVRDFVQWLRTENLRREVATAAPYFAALPVALFGLDIYSMFASSDQVVAYLDAVDPSMAERARQRYAVLQAFRPSEADYGRAVLSGHVPPQTSKIRHMLHELEDHASAYKRLFGDGDAFFSAHENARVVLAAEEYYRRSYLGDGGSSLTWNLRDHAMVDMIVNALAFHDEKLAAMHADDVARNRATEDAQARAAQAQSQPLVPQRARAVVWAHNSHIGDAAATEQGERFGQVNVGHLVRQALGEDDCYLIGMTTNTGTVRAAHRWNGRDHVMKLNPALDGSVGALLHHASVVAPPVKDFGLFFRRNAPVPSMAAASDKHSAGSVDAAQDRSSSRSSSTATSTVSASTASSSKTHSSAHTSNLLSPAEAAARAEMAKTRPERFVGVQYVKQREREAHYSLCSASRQFDLLVHIDETSALRPLSDGGDGKPSV